MVSYTIDDMALIAKIKARPNALRNYSVRQKKNHTLVEMFH